MDNKVEFKNIFNFHYETAEECDYAKEVTRDILSLLEEAAVGILRIENRVIGPLSRDPISRDPILSALRDMLNSP